MSLAYRTDRIDPRFARWLDVEIVVPVYNEAHDLEDSVRRLRDYLDRFFPFRSLVTIVDNASSDATPAIARRLAAELSDVRSVRIDDKGRGRALRKTWLESEASVVAYMDADLSTDLAAVLPLVAPLLSGHSDIAIGTRLAPGSRVVRGPKRELISRAYNLLVRTVLGSAFTDAQCGFKAMSREAAQALLPLVADNGWFFDTELLVLAQRNGLRIHEVPVDWTDRRDSTVEIAATARGDLMGIWRLLRVFMSGGGWTETSGRPRDDLSHLRRTAGIGAVSTVVYVSLFLALRPSLGPMAANLVALGATTLANVSAHAALTRGARSDRVDGSHLVGVLAATMVSLALTTCALLVASLVAPSAAGDVVAVTLASIAAAPIRLLTARACRS